MKGDFSRDSHDRSKAFSRVLIQQGRVALDADFNEHVSITSDRFRELARHIIGPGAGPADSCGFRVVSDVAELENEVPGPGDEERSALAAGDLVIMPGTYFVGGLPVRLESRLLYSSQPGFSFNGDGQLPGAIDVDSDWIACLEVWEEFIAPAQDPALLDPALGGADTSGRAAIFWEVRVVLERTGQDPDMATSTRRGRMRASTLPGEPGGYLGHEDNLYRVEVHSGTDRPAKPGTFKWSRDNGSRLFPVSRLAEDIVELGDHHHPEVDALQVGDWVEVSRSDLFGREALNRMGRIEGLGPDERTLTVSWAPPGRDEGERSPVDGPWFLRKWDHAGPAEHGGTIPLVVEEEIQLEEGVVIEFETGGHFRRGDYWLIPARSSLRDIMWAGNAGGGGSGFLQPRGPDRFLTPLAMRKQGKVVDLRQQFHPISRPVDPT